MKIQIFRSVEYCCSSIPWKMPRDQRGSSVFSGTLEIKSIADDKGWHFCSIIHGATFRIDAAEWVEISIPGRAWPGIEFSVHAWSSQVPAPGRACTDPQPRAVLCQGLWTSHFIPWALCSSAKRHDDCLLCKVLQDLLEISALKRGVSLFPPRHRAVAVPLSLPPRESRKWWWCCGWGKQEIMVVLWFET